MHAYLIIGEDNNKRRETSEQLAQKLKAKIFEFPLAKIDDVRQLKSVTSLKVTSPTAIYIDSIEKASEEALNAFLKNLEEPQENLFYLLTASTQAQILPTIVSRCQVIKLSVNSKLAATPKYIKPSLAMVNKIKGREEALDFVQNLIKQMHFSLLNNEEDRVKFAKNLGITVKTLKNLEANGNVNLQLSNMVINLN